MIKREEQTYCTTTRQLLLMPCLWSLFFILLKELDSRSSPPWFKQYSYETIWEVQNSLVDFTYTAYDKVLTLLWCNTFSGAQLMGGELSFQLTPRIGNTVLSVLRLSNVFSSVFCFVLLCCLLHRLFSFCVWLSWLVFQALPEAIFCCPCFDNCCRLHQGTKSRSFVRF